jgi:PAS domain-containing protein/HPt (histidine-containing phosphotransfer) domain-containing protein
MTNSDPNHLSVNQIIQAGQSLLTLVEASKAQLEELLDGLSDAFGVVTETGQIMRSNISFSAFGGFAPEESFEQNFLEYFCKEDRSLVSVALKKIVGSATQENTKGTTIVSGFEGTLTAAPTRIVQWDFKPFFAQRDECKNWVQVHGRDVTASRDQDRKLAQIFSNLPIGIFQLDHQFSIQPPVSERCQFLLETKELEGKNFFDVLFKPCWETLSIAEKEAVGLLMGLVGSHEVQFDLVKDELPKRIVIQTNSPQQPERILSLNFNPLVRNSIIDCLLVLTEDRTEVEKASKVEERRVAREGSALRRYKETIAVDMNLAPVIVRDLEKCLAQIEDLKKNVVTEIKIVKILHSIKGLARIGKLNTLKQLAHTLEDKALHSSSEVDSNSLLQDLDAVREECFECLLLVKFRLQMLHLNTDQKGPTWNQMMKIQVESNIVDLCQKLGKNVRLDWTETNDPSILAQDSFEAALLHGVTNCLDHGIEVPDIREQNGKSGQGTISVLFSTSENCDVLKIQDDGKGFDLAKLRAKIVNWGMPAKMAEALSETEILSYLFKDGLSTAEKVTEVSGRGVGIGVVESLAKEAGGTAWFESKKPHGSLLTVKIPRKGTE